MMMANTVDKKICVLGLGYIGLPTSAVLASRGYEVHGVEVNPKSAEIINSGRAHIVEPELDILVRAAVHSGKLKAFPAPAPADIFMICVPTPITEEKTADLSYVESASRSLAAHVKPGDLIILESTSPPGTTEFVRDVVLANSTLSETELYFAHAPERVLPGKIMREVVENDRIVGGLSPQATEVCAQFYATFVSGQIHQTTARTAETAKLVENAFRDVNIAFANELSQLAEKLEVDVWELIRLANRHPRVNILSPGAGVGGHCIAVDPWFLIEKAPEQTTLIRRARDINDARPKHWVQKIEQRASRFKAPKIACLGLAYKPDIDDLRESPAVEIVKELQQNSSLELLIVEPNLEDSTEFALVELSAAIADADIVVFLVAHQEFKKLKPATIAEKIIIDACGALQH